MNRYTINPLSSSLDVINDLSQADGDARYVLKAGDTMTGALIVGGDITAYESGQTRILQARSSDNMDYISLYNTGSFGQIESSNSFVLTAPNGTAVVGTSNPQLRVQYGAGSFRSLTLYHDDSDAYFATNEGDIFLQPASGNVTVENTITADDFIGVPPVVSSKQIVKQNNFSVYDALESGWTDQYGNGTVGFDTSDFREGAGSIKLIADNATGLTGMIKALAGNWSAKTFRFWVKSDDWTNVSLASLLISTNAFTDFYFIHINSFIVGKTDNEWIEVSIPRSAFSASGTPNWTTVDSVIFRLVGVNGQTPTVWFDGFGLVNEPSAGIVSIVFDDSRASAYTTGKPIMDIYGYRGTMYAIPDLIGTADYMTQAQTDNLHNSGWDIAGHHQTNLSDITAAAAETAVRSVSHYLREKGYRGAEHFAYPNGVNNDSIRSIVQRYFTTGRTIDGMNQPRNYINPMRVNAITVSSGDSTATLQGYIDNAINNKEWLILVFHNIVTTPTVSTEYSTANFDTIIDYLNSNSANVLPVSQALV